VSGSALLAAAMACGSVALLVPAPAGSRLDVVLDRARPGTTAPRSPKAGRLGGGGRPTPGPSMLLAAAMCGLGAALVVGGWAGVVTGAGAAAVTVVVLRRLEPRAVRLRRERMAADLPTAVDLLAACLVSGRPPAAALGAVVEAVGGPLAEELQVVAVRLHLVPEVGGVWRGGGRPPGPLAALGRTMARSLDTGAPMADGLRLLASDLRRAHRAAVERKARGVGVRAAAPLGLCFLPAFVLVGIVPTVVSAFAAMSWW
jgi:Flp pilus assembly protein TadB